MELSSILETEMDILLGGCSKTKNLKSILKS